MDSDRIARRVKGRKEADGVIGLVDLPHHDCVEAFLDELRRRLLPDVVAVEAEKEQRTICDLSAHTLEFGAHAGKRLDEIERGYLHWLLQSSELTVSAVGDYLRATAGQDEDGDEN